MDKAGHTDKEVNPSNVIWNVDFNKALSDLTNATITENFPDSVRYDSSQPPVIYPLIVDLEGNVIGVSNQAVPTDQYTVDANGNITFNQPISGAYRIVYTTPINDSAKPTDGGTVTATNEVTLCSDGLADASADTTITFDYGKTLTKTKDKYDPTTQTYTWTIHYNYGQKDIPIYVPITDIFSNMDLVDGSIVLNYMNFIDDGKVIKGAVVPEDAYTVNVDKTGQLVITFNDNVQQNQGIDITYQTKVDQIVSDGSTQIKNDVSMDGVTNPPTISDNPKQQAVIKNKPTIDYANKTAFWTVDINKNNYDLTNAEFIDTMDYTEAGYVSLPRITDTDDNAWSNTGVVIHDNKANKDLVGAIEVIDKTTEIVFGDPATADYILKIYVSAGAGAVGSKYDKFTINFVNNYQTTNHSFKMSYYTKYNQFETPAVNPGGKLSYDNNINLTWQDGDDTYSSDSNNGFDTSTSESHQGFKAGSYNPLTKEITWTIVTNYNGLDINQFTVKDPITGNQVYLPDSLNITRGTITTNGSFEATSQAEYAGNQVGADYVKVTNPVANENSNGILDIAVGPDIPGFNSKESPKVFKIEFKTSLQGQIVEDAATYDNVAKVTIGNEEQDLSAEVSINYAGETASKKVDYDSKTGLISWSLWLNRSQSALKNPVVTDYPSNNQIIDLASVKVYQGKVDSEGKVTQGAAVLAENYTVDLQTDPVTGQQILKVSFDTMQEEGQPTGVIEKPYLITYQAKPNFTSQEEVISNSAQVTSDGGSYEGEPTSDNQKVHIEDSSGIAWGTKGSLTIQKIGEITQQALPGAKLQLIRHYEKANLPDEILYTVTTGATGQASFGNLIYSDKDDPNRSFTYLIKEVEALAGYTISDELLAGVPVTVDDKTSNGEILAIDNQPVAIHFLKVNAAQEALTGGSFALQKKNDQGHMEVVRVFAATAEGVTFTGLTDGDYQIREVAAPDGYMLNPMMIEFTVKLKENGQRGIFVKNAAGELIESTGNLTMTDYQASATFKKVDSQGVGLAGAEFELSHADYQSGDYSVVAKVISDKDGLVVMNNLAPGDYLLKETKAPAGYYLNGTEIKFTISYQAGQTPEPLEILAETGFVNYLGTAEFKKTEADGKTGLADAVFELLDENDQPVEVDGKDVEVTSDQDGIFKIANLMAGATYGLREIKAPTGYIKNDTIIRFTMPVSQSADETGVTIDSEKAAEIPVYTETTPFRNYQGLVQFTKVASTKDNQEKVNLAGAAFKLYQVDGDELGKQITAAENGANEDRLFISSSNGLVQAGDLAPGAYLFEEVQAPDGYILQVEDPATPLKERKLYFEVVEDAEGEVALKDLGTYENYLGEAIFKKVAEDGSDLAGAVFTIEKKGPGENSFTKLDITVKSNPKGEVELEDLGPGTYRITESQAPEGYYLKPTVIEFTISETASKELEIIDLNQQLVNYLGSAKFVKTASDGVTTLADAEFILLDEDNKEIKIDGERKVYTSDSKGVITIENLKAGKTYGLQEIKAPTGYILNDSIYSFTMPASEDAEITDATENLVYNGEVPFKNYQGVVHFTKVGQPKLSDDKTQVPLAGAKYALYQVKDGKQGQQITATKNGANQDGYFVSDSNGLVQAGDLEPGDYQFVEVEAPAGYILNPTPITFTIVAEAEGAVEVDNQEAVINYQGAAELVKVTENQKPLANAEFAVYREFFGTTPAQLITTVKSDKDGIVLVEELAPGNYYFQEIATPENAYIINSEKIHFTIDEKSAVKPTVVAANTKENPLINYLGDARLQKVDENQKALAGAIFKVVDEKGQTVKGNEKLVADENGYVLATNLAPGKYAFVEIQAADGYLLNSQPVPFEIIQSTEGEPELVTSYQEKLLQLVNYQGSGELTKVDQATKATLKGAVFQLLDAQGKVIKDNLTTDKDGKIVVTGLAPGKYSFKEIKAPDNYQLSQKTWDFEITDKAEGKPVAVQITAENSKDEEPNQPGNPNEPNQPGTPGNSGNPSNPNTPGSSTTPKTPSNPKSPSGGGTGGIGSTGGSLPKTGEEANFTLSIFGVLAIGVGLYLVWKRHEKRS
ncbi:MULTISPECIES: SpaA isopeptide-forming pilin-related protein [unclassified Enterococcus]|uniref:SpaA isopeptide-forming pilin-related protein n=1 Tax=Enterococcus sp. PFB1-1 TaxID=2940634 RepID=UPI0024751FF4|nr:MULTISPECIES: SpaA isopeptide-forming pilin-related protein [unclassified Enterococcus]